MIRKSLFAFFLLSAFSLAVFAQSAPVRGVVEMTQADGKKVPVAGALVEVYRTDMKAKFPSAKTDKKGVFVFAGLPLGGEFTLSISGAGISPTTYPGVKAGKEDIAISVSAGDGKKLTEDEVRSNSGSASVSTGELSAADKKKYEEEQKKIAEIKAGNAEIEENNKIILKVYDEGNVALKANNYDLAISKFSEGIALDANHPGTPALLINRSSAYRRRGVDRFNAALKAGGEGLAAAKQDFVDAGESAKTAIDLLKTTTPPTDPDQLKNHNGYKYNSQAAYAEALRLISTKVDQSKSGEMKTAYQDYLAIETDPVQKSKTQLSYAQALMDSQDFESAVVEFEKVIADNPNEFRAYYGAGLCLVNLGYVTNDKVKFQTGANYIAKFIELAPDTDPAVAKNKSEMKETLDSLKKEQNVTAQKPAKTTTPKKKP